MPGVQFQNQLDMNGFKVTEMGPATAGTDAVNLDQLNAAIAGLTPRGYAADIGDGTSTTLTVTHALATLDVIVQVYAKATGETVTVDPIRTNPNTVTIGFGTAPALNAYRVVVLPKP